MLAGRARRVAERLPERPAVVWPITATPYGEQTMFDLDRFNGLWAVCEASYTTDPDKPSFARSMMLVNGRVCGYGTRDCFVPLFTAKADAEALRDRVCGRLNRDPGEFKAVQIFSLRQLADVLRDFRSIGRCYLRIDGGPPVRVRDLLPEAVRRLL
jgi:hypothetical protein